MEKPGSDAVPSDVNPRIDAGLDVPVTIVEDAAPLLDTLPDVSDAEFDTVSDSMRLGGGESDVLGDSEGSGHPCIATRPAANTGPGTQGEYRVSLGSPIAIPDGGTVPTFLAGGNGVAEIVYLDGVDIVDRVIARPLERRAPVVLSAITGSHAAKGDNRSVPYSNICDGQLAVLLPASRRTDSDPLQLDLAMLDLAACRIRPTGTNILWITPMTSYGLTKAVLTSSSLAVSRSHYISIFGGERGIDVSVLDTAGAVATGAGMPARYTASARLPPLPVTIMPPALSDVLVAYVRMAGTLSTTCEIVWATFAGTSGIIPQVACDQPLVAAGRRIAWSDGHVRIFDTETGVQSQVTSFNSRQSNPLLHGRLLAYEDDRNGNLDIYVTDVGSGIESPVYIGAADQHLLGVHSDGIVWWTALPEGIAVFWNPAFAAAER